MRLPYNYFPNAPKYFSASIAAAHPEPAAVIERCNSCAAHFAGPELAIGSAGSTTNDTGGMAAAEDPPSAASVPAV